MEFERINIKELGLPVGPYCHAVRQGDLLVTSGFTAFGTPAQSGPIDAQAEAIFAQMRTLAESQASSMERLLKVTIFVTRLDGIIELREQLVKAYGTHLPASSLVQVAGLFHPDLSIEIEATFAL